MHSSTEQYQNGVILFFKWANDFVRDIFFVALQAILLQFFTRVIYAVKYFPQNFC